MAKPPTDPNHELMWLLIRLAGGEEVSLGIPYHAPKLLYESHSLTDRISQEVEEIITNKPDAIICFVGNLNKLKTDVVLKNELGMLQIVM